MSSLIPEAIKAIAGGTFIYVALAEIILAEFNSRSAPDMPSPWRKFVFLSIGLAIMTVFTLWFGH